jgi:hypothetical protein
MAQDAIALPMREESGKDDVHFLRSVERTFHDPWMVWLVNSLPGGYDAMMRRIVST